MIQKLGVNVAFNLVTAMIQKLGVNVAFNLVTAMIEKLGVNVAFKKLQDSSIFSCIEKKTKIKYTSSGLNSSACDDLPIIYLLITPLKGINFHQNIILQKYIELVFLRIILL